MWWMAGRDRQWRGALACCCARRPALHPLSEIINTAKLQATGANPRRNVCNSRSAVVLVRHLAVFYVAKFGLQPHPSNSRPPRISFSNKLAREFSSRMRN